MTRVANNTSPALGARLLILLLAIYASTALLLWSAVPSQLIAPTLTLVGASIWLSMTDFQRHEIPDLANLCILASGLVARALTDWHSIPVALTFAVLTLAALWWAGGLFFRYRGVEGLGIGDAKLLAALTVWIGPTGLPTMVLYASLGALIYLLLSRRPKQGLAFGPFLAYSNLLVWLTGPIGG